MKTSFSFRFVYSAIAIFLLSFTNTYAQSSHKIIGIYPDNTSVKDNDVFLISDKGSFSIVNASGEKEVSLTGEWTLQCLDIHNQYAVERSVENTNDFNLSLGDFRFDNDTLAVVSLDGDSSCYFRAKVVFNGQNQAGNTINAEFPVLLNLLPSKPKVEILDIHLEDNVIYFGLSTESARVEQIIIVVKRKVGNRIYTLSHVLSVDEAKNVHECSTLSDGVFVIPIARNKFGDVSYEEINLSDFITSIENNSATSQVSLYPNPVKDIINIQGDISTIKSISCVNVSGQTVMQINKLEGRQIDVSNLPSGMYILEFQYIEKGKKESFKIIKH